MSTQIKLAALALLFGLSTVASVQAQDDPVESRPVVETPVVEGEDGERRATLFLLEEPRIGDPIARSERFGIEAVLLGHRVRVTDVDFGSPAERFGLERGDVIVRANGRAVRDLAVIENAARDNRGNLELEVIDVRSGRSVTQEVYLREFDRGFGDDPVCSISGRWQSAISTIELVQVGGTIMGIIVKDSGERGIIQHGDLSGNRLSFDWMMTDGQRGIGSVRISRDGSTITGTMTNDRGVRYDIHWNKVGFRE